MKSFKNCDFDFIMKKPCHIPCDKRFYILFNTCSHIAANQALIIYVIKKPVHLYVNYFDEILKQIF